MRKAKKGQKLEDKWRQQLKEQRCGGRTCPEKVETHFQIDLNCFWTSNLSDSVSLLSVKLSFC